MGGGIPTFEYPLEKFIWTFHVSLFFFLSGYVYKITQKWKSKGTRTRFIAYKFIKVAVPYFSISIFYILINSLTAKTNTSFSVTDIFSLWKTPVAQYWYIYALFMLLLLYAVLSKVCFLSKQLQLWRKPNLFQGATTGKCMVINVCYCFREFYFF